MALNRSLKGLVALVTGGASGLGRATAERFSQLGLNVAICDLPTSSGAMVAKNLGSNCIFSPADVSKESDVKNTMEIVQSNFKKLDIVINCAGLSTAFKIYNFLKDQPQKLKDLECILQANTVGTFNVNRLAIEMLAKNTPDEEGQRGVIINTSGISAYEGIIGQGAFSASCHALVSMTLPMARDLSSHGIRVCTIAPGI
ncbi:3-hydroxyacyl-CoA dehydrogenase type-2 [Nephila pilipes]|uniref:3-hydroxyacyl-CoA dehydrogenase type-2 n=1 Tax=Nephila pilipes TaxID=299642 RepID=A0A8X6UF43_NEPPI|nr:3-hydroxyacyl-CoA dehydrogenase type-2 [Nephila pilipes]